MLLLRSHVIYESFCLHVVTRPGCWIEVPSSTASRWNCSIDDPWLAQGGLSQSQRLLAPAGRAPNRAWPERS